MHTFSVIEQLNIFKNISLYLFHCIVLSLVDLFFFKVAKKLFTQELSYRHPGLLMLPLIPWILNIS